MNRRILLTAPAVLAAATVTPLQAYTETQPVPVKKPMYKLAFIVDVPDDLIPIKSGVGSFNELYAYCDKVAGVMRGPHPGRFGERMSRITLTIGDTIDVGE